MCRFFTESLVELVGNAQSLHIINIFIAESTRCALARLYLDGEALASLGILGDEFNVRNQPVPLILKFERKSALQKRGGSVGLEQRP